MTGDIEVSEGSSMNRTHIIRAAAVIKCSYLSDIDKLDKAKRRTVKFIFDTPEERKAIADTIRSMRETDREKRDAA